MTIFNAEWLKKMRLQKGLTQQELANKTGLTKFTIENIEQGRRKGSELTWEKLLNFFENDSNVSYDSDDLIKEIKADIEEFGEDEECFIFYKETKYGLFFTNYDFDVEEEPIKEDELEAREYLLKTTLGDALKLFERQNKIF